MLLSLVLLGVLGTAVTTVLVRQHRFYSDTANITDMRNNVRDVAELLAVELRGISPVGGDIYAMSDLAIDFRAPIGHSVVCTIGGGRTSLTIPPTQLALQGGLTAWVAPLRAGDSLFIYDEGATSALSDDSWMRFALLAAPTAGTCPMVPTGFTTTPAEAAAAYTLSVSPALPAGVVIGSAIRFYRRAQYRLYPGASGWFAGYAECTVGTCGPLAPVAGPLQPYAASTASGLRLSYFDSTGAETADRNRVARIVVSVRGRTRGAVRSSGLRQGYYSDSLAVSIALRNRS